MNCKPNNKPGQVRNVPIDDLTPYPENDTLYRPVLADDPEIIKLAESIRQNGVYEPLVVSLDGFIISGHRRYCAAKLAGLKTVPVRYVDIKRTDDIDAFVLLLREHNRQRDKSNAERLREELLTVDPTIAYRSLIAHRQKLSTVEVDEIILGKRRKRSKISKDKQEFRQAILDVVHRYRNYWPLTDRRVHYYLLNNPPMKNTGKAHWARYGNNPESYDNLTGMLTRMRLHGDIPFSCLTDETRPVIVWECHQNPRPFFSKQLDKFCQFYWRDLMQSQPNHIEILAEKNTVFSTVKSVAEKYCIPVTSGRGHSSLDPRYQMFQRYKRSGKDSLVLLVVSDFDPSGECIAESFCRSMRDDFNCDNIVPIKAALTFEQVKTMDLQNDGIGSKEGDGQRKAFHKKYGKDQKCYELEALEPDALASILTQTIDSVIDHDAFNAELDQEKKDSVFVEAVRNQAVSHIQELLANIENTL